MCTNTRPDWVNRDINHGDNGGRPSMKDKSKGIQEAHVQWLLTIDNTNNGRQRFTTQTAQWLADAYAYIHVQPSGWLMHTRTYSPVADEPQAG